MRSPLLFSAWALLAWTVQAIEIRVGHVDAEPGDRIMVPIFVDSADSDSIGYPSVICFEIHVHSTHLQPLSFDVGSDAAAEGFVALFSPTSVNSGRAAVFSFDRASIQGGEIAQLELLVLEDAEHGAKSHSLIEISNLSAASPHALTLPVTATPGSVTVVVPSGLPLSAWPLLLLSALMLILVLRRRPRTAAFALLLLGLFATSGQYVHALFVAGDLDDSGEVTEEDVVAVAMAYLEDNYSARADLDLSGTVDARDIQLAILLRLGFNRDADGDGLLDDAEHAIGTNPLLLDSDADGVNDADEILAGTNPAEPPAAHPWPVINEFVASNSRGLRDHENDEEDWIEIYNGGTEAFSLDGWSMTDNVNQPRKWMFPDIDIAAGEYLVVFASEKPGVHGELHAQFKLGKGGEYLALIDPDGVARSAFSPNFPAQQDDISYGRYGAGTTFRYFTVPTPGAPNVILDNTYSGFLPAISVHPPRGVYQDSLQVTVTGAAPGAEVWYTSDGSVPAPGNGLLYTGPVDIHSTAALRFRAYGEDLAPTPVVSQSYLLGLSSEQQALPIVVINGDPQQSLYEPNGIMSIVGGEHVRLADLDPATPFPNVLVWIALTLDDINNPLRRDDGVEKPVSLEFFDTQGADDAQIHAGLRVQGSDFHRLQYRRDPGNDWRQPAGPITFGMWTNYNKFSFRVKFNRAYGPPKFEYKLFGEDEEKFDQLILRGGHNDGYNPFICDELVRRLATQMGHVSSRGKLVNLFIIDEHKGYYNLVERLDEDFFRLRYDSDEDWDVIVHEVAELEWDVRDGDGTAWSELLAFIAGNDLAIPANYDWVMQRLDIENLIDYMILQIYVGNFDWLGNNWVAARERSESGKFRFHVWDAENSFRPFLLNSTPFAPLGYPGIPQQSLNDANSLFGRLHTALRANAAYRSAFAQRAHFHLDGNGALSAANVLQAYEPLRDDMMAVLPGFLNDIETVWIPNRLPVVINALAQQGLY